MCEVHRAQQDRHAKCSLYIKPSYTPPTPTRLDCGVESRRRCVRNSQLWVGDSLATSLNKFPDSKVEPRRIGGVNRERTSRQSWPSLQFPVLLSQSQLSYWGMVTSDDIMTSLLKKLSISIKIHVVKPSCSVSRLLTESVGSRRELVANSVHTADATRLDSWVASAVGVGLTLVFCRAFTVIAKGPQMISQIYM